MPLIIIEHKSEEETPKMTYGRVPVSSDILVPQSLEMTNSEDQGVLSAPMSPNRVRKGHSQDMPAERSIFDVSPDVPGITCDRLGVGHNQQTLPRPHRRTTSVSTTRSLEHQLRLLSVSIPRVWIQRRLYRSIIYRKTVVLESISRQYRPCTPREFHRTLSLGRPQRISFEKDRLMCVQPHGNGRQSINKYEHAGLPVQNDFIYRNGYGGRGH